jgi:hypothetical protein
MLVTPHSKYALSLVFVVYLTLFPPVCNEHLLVSFTVPNFSLGATPVNEWTETSTAQKERVMFNRTLDFYCQNRNSRPKWQCLFCPKPSVGTKTNKTPRMETRTISKRHWHRSSGHTEGKVEGPTRREHRNCSLGFLWEITESYHLFCDCTSI